MHICEFVYVHSKLLQSCPTLCDPMDCSLPGSSVHGILQAKYWSRLLCPPPGDLPDPGIEPVSLMSPALQAGSFTTELPGKPSAVTEEPNSTSSIIFIVA